MKKGGGKIKYSYLEGNKEIERVININETHMDVILKRLIEENILLSIHSCEPNLEDIFIEVTGRCLQ